MLVGVSTASLYSRRYNEDALSLFNELDIRLAEVFLTTFSEYGEEFARTLQAVQGNVNVHSVHVLNTQFEPQLLGTHPRASADAFAWLEKVLCTAEILGAKHYTFHGLARVKRVSRSGQNDRIDEWIPRVRKIAEACEKHGVTLCLENVEWATYNRPGVFAELAKRVDKLGGVLDIKQARISGYPYEAYLNEMGNRIQTVHLSDIDEHGKMCLPGRGSFDFVTLIKRLRDIGFRGALLIEAYADDYGEERELKTSCEYLEELVDKYAENSHEI